MKQMQKPSPSTLAASLLVGLAFLGTGCTTPPLERAEAIRDEEPLPRTVFMKVDAGDLEEPAGWAETLVRVCRELNVATAVWDEAGTEKEADLVVTVRLSRKPRAGPAVEGSAGNREAAQEGPPAEEPEVLPAGAVLDFLAWSSMPLAAWWIADVNVDPGIAGTLEWSLSAGQGPGAPPDPRALSVPKIATSLRERFPVLSWPTLGALVLPPFVFSSHDEEHLSAHIRDRLQEEVAVQAARTLKKDGKESLLAEEFLHNLAVDPKRLVLEYHAAPHVGRVEVRLESLDGELVTEDRIRREDRDLKKRSLALGERLRDHQPRAGAQAPLLRVLAISRLPDGGRRSYSIPLRIPPADLADGGKRP